MFIIRSQFTNENDTFAVEHRKQCVLICEVDDKLNYFITDIFLEDGKLTSVLCMDPSTDWKYHRNVCSTQYACSLPFQEDYVHSE